MNVYFTEDGKISESSSNEPYGAITGAQGGSQMINEYIRQYIKDKEMEAHLTWQIIEEGDIASLLQDFDRQKRNLNYNQLPNSTGILLQSTRGRSIVIPNDEIRRAFEITYQAGLELLKKELDRMTQLGRDFTVLFAGGSFKNPGLCHKAKTIMDEWRNDEEARDISMNYVFLRDELLWYVYLHGVTINTILHILTRTQGRRQYLRVRP